MSRARPWIAVRSGQGRHYHFWRRSAKPDDHNADQQGRYTSIFSCGDSAFYKPVGTPNQQCQSRQYRQYRHGHILVFSNQGAVVTQAERESGKALGILGSSFITEGTIPFAAKNPLRVIPSLIVGSAVAGALSMYFGVELRAPHGGLFVLFIPNAITNLQWYAIAIAIGTAMTIATLLLLKPSLEELKAMLVAGLPIK